MSLTAGEIVKINAMCPIAKETQLGSEINAAANPAASETVSGIAELATQVETDAGTDDLRIVTPKKLENSAVNIAVALNTTHASSDGTDHANVVTNDTHVAGDGSDHADVALNTVAANQVVVAEIVVPDTGSAATAAALTLSLEQASAIGTPVTAVREVMILASLTQNDPQPTLLSTVTFASATTGAIVDSGNGWALVRTDVDGDFACTVSDSADEVVFFRVASADNIATLAERCVVAGCIGDTAEWTA